MHLKLFMTTLFCTIALCFSTLLHAESYQVELTFTEESTQKVEEGTAVTVTAKDMRADGLYFNGWKGKGIDLSPYQSLEQFTFTMPDTNITIQAVYEGKNSSLIYRVALTSDSVYNGVNIQMVVDAAQATSSILVGEGEVYGNIYCDKSISIYGGYPNTLPIEKWALNTVRTERTLFSQNANKSVIEFTHNNRGSRLDRLIIQNGKGTIVNNETYGGNIYNAAKAENLNINQCIIQNGHADWGGGTYNAIIESSEIQNCNATKNGGGSVYGSLNNSTIYECNATLNGGGTYGTRIVNSKIYSNTANCGGAAYGGNIINSTIYNNQAACGAATYNAQLTHTTLIHNKADSYIVYRGSIENTIIANNIVDTEGVVFLYTPSDKLEASVVWRNTIKYEGGKLIVKTPEAIVGNIAVEGSSGYYINLHSDNLASTGPQFVEPTTFQGLISTDEQWKEIESMCWDIWASSIMAKTSIIENKTRVKLPSIIAEKTLFQVSQASALPGVGITVTYIGPYNLLAWDLTGIESSVIKSMTYEKIIFEMPKNDVYINAKFTIGGTNPATYLPLSNPASNQMALDKLIELANAHATQKNIYLGEGVFSGTYQIPDGVNIYGGLTGSEKYWDLERTERDSTLTRFIPNSTGAVFNFTGTSKTNILDGVTLDSGEIAITATAENPASIQQCNFINFNSTKTLITNANIINSKILNNKASKLVDSVDIKESILAFNKGNTQNAIAFETLFVFNTIDTFNNTKLDSSVYLASTAPSIHVDSCKDCWISGRNLSTKNYDTQSNKGAQIAKFDFEQFNTNKTDTLLRFEWSFYKSTALPGYALMYLPRIPNPTLTIKNCPTIDSVDLLPTQIITVNPYPSAQTGNHDFSHWSVTGIDISDSTTENPLVFPMGFEDVVVKANYHFPYAQNNEGWIYDNVTADSIQNGKNLQNLIYAASYSDTNQIFLPIGLFAGNYVIPHKAGIFGGFTGTDTQNWHADYPSRLWDRTIIDAQAKGSAFSYTNEKGTLYTNLIVIQNCAGVSGIINDPLKNWSMLEQTTIFNNQSDASILSHAVVSNCKIINNTSQSHILDTSIISSAIFVNNSTTPSLLGHVILGEGIIWNNQYQNTIGFIRGENCAIENDSRLGVAISSENLSAQGPQFVAPNTTLGYLGNGVIDTQIAEKYSLYNSTYIDEAFKYNHIATFIPRIAGDVPVITEPELTQNWRWYQEPLGDTPNIHAYAPNGEELSSLNWEWLNPYETVLSSKNYDCKTSCFTNADEFLLGKKFQVYVQMLRFNAPSIKSIVTTNAGYEIKINPAKAVRNPMTKASILPTHYNIYVREAAHIPYTRLSTHTDITQPIALNLDPKINYHVVVTASYSNGTYGESVFSKVKNTSKTLTPNNFTVSATQGTLSKSIKLSWNMIPTYNYIKLSVFTPDAPTTPQVLLLTKKTNYTYKINSEKFEGKVFKFTVEISDDEMHYKQIREVTGFSLLTPPRMNKAIAQSNGVQLSWYYKTAAPINTKTFTIARTEKTLGDASTVAFKTTSDSFLDYTGVPGKDYTYYVMNGDVDTPSKTIGKWSNGVKGYKLLEAPESFSATNGVDYNQISLKWNIPEGATYFRVYRQNPITEIYAPVSKWIAENAYNDKDLSLNNTISYNYKVVSATSKSGAKASQYSHETIGKLKVGDIDSVKIAAGMLMNLKHDQLAIDAPNPINVAPTTYCQYTDPVTGKIKKLTLKSYLTENANDSILIYNTHAVMLFNASNYNKSIKNGHFTASYLTQSEVSWGQLDSLPTELWFKGASKDLVYKKQTLRTFVTPTFQNPEITHADSMKDGKLDLRYDTEKDVQMPIYGKYFGTGTPKAWIEYKVNGKTAVQKMNIKVNPILSKQTYSNSRYTRNDGSSEMLITLPKSWINTPWNYNYNFDAYLVISSGKGMATFPVLLGARPKPPKP